MLPVRSCLKKTVAIIPLSNNDAHSHGKPCLKKFEQSMNKQKIIHDIPVSIAYGVAMADHEKDLEALYRVADERMYHKKQMQKEGMQ
jgi:GGDEF domain-containing protein